jgi:hypothetical protein
MDTLVINTPGRVEPPRIPIGNPLKAGGHPADCDDTRAGLLKIAALYTMNTYWTQSLLYYDRDHQIA